jgi:hypothetical protein
MTNVTLVIPADSLTLWGAKRHDEKGVFPRFLETQAN